MNKIQENYFPMHLVPLSDDENIVAYVSKYVSQKNFTSFTDFKPIMKALDILHAKGYVHSDVRTANLVFPVDSKEEVKLIDFDLTDREFKPYPLGYNKIHEYHPSASSESPRRKIHD